MNETVEAVSTNYTAGIIVGIVVLAFVLWRVFKPKKKSTGTSTGGPSGSSNKVHKH